MTVIKAPHTWILGVCFTEYIILAEWVEGEMKVMNPEILIPAQKEYKARHDWVGKVIHWEMCRKFQFDHTNKWYKHNPAPVQENDSHKLLWDFKTQTDHLIPARRPDLIIINKRKGICKIVDFAVPADHRINLKESEKKDKYLDLARELKNCGTWKLRLCQLWLVR